MVEGRRTIDNEGSFYCFCESFVRDEKVMLRWEGAGGRGGVITMVPQLRHASDNLFYIWINWH